MSCELYLNTPLCLKAYTGNNLQNEFFWRKAHCVNANTEAFEQLIIFKTYDEKFIIQSRWNGRNLQCQPDGKCVFANQNQELWEKFEIEADEEGHLYFVSCHTGMVMQCTGDGRVICANKNRLRVEQWRVIYLENTDMLTSEKLRNISLITTGAVVAGVLPLTLGAIAAACVPAAMVAFGTVVPGVGTMHASLAAGGVTATLQSTSAGLLSGGSAICGATSGAVIAGAGLAHELTKNDLSMNNSSYIDIPIRNYQ